MIEICYDEGSERIALTGHAGAGEYGSDIVCAAVSILVLAAERMLGERVKGARGEAEIQGGSREIMQTLMAGFEWLGENCSEYVKVIRRTECTKN